MLYFLTPSDNILRLDKDLQLQLKVDPDHLAEVSTIHLYNSSLHHNLHQVL